MLKLLRRLAILLLCCIPRCYAQTTTTITGTIKDLTGAVVTSGTVTFDLQPAIQTIIGANASFTPSTVICNIQSNGTLQNVTNSGACVVTMNTALTPPGTSYKVTFNPYNSNSSAIIGFYAYQASQDITTFISTPASSPCYNCGVSGAPAVSSIQYVDGFINPTIQSAITALGSNSGEVIVPCGAYTVSSPLIIPSSVLLLGCGMGNTTSGGTRIVAANGSVSPIVEIQGSSPTGRVGNIFIRDLTIQGVYTSSQACMQIDHATYIVQDHVQYVQCGQAEWDNDVYRSLHTDVSYFQSGSGGTNTTATVRAENISNPSVPSEQIFFDHCVWQGDAGGKQGTAVYFGPATEEEGITNSKLDYSGTSPGFPVVYVNQPQIVDISHNTISGFSSIAPSPAVVYVTGTNPTRAFEVHISNNTQISFSNTVPGILLDYATDYEVVGGTFQGPGSGTAVQTTANTFGGSIGPFQMASVDTPINDVSGFAGYIYHNPSGAGMVLGPVYVGGGSKVNKLLQGSAIALNSAFTSITAGTCQEQTLTLTGAATTGISVVNPGGALGTGFSWQSWVSAANTITVRVCAGATGTPNSVTWNAEVTQ